ncbi:MAG TPA: dihydrofolate reductase family protein [Anaerolineales bacterium]|nr:dihydrofolate reductase family protein [Anaerolineales bacterium]
MRKIVMINWVSLDGFFAGPNGEIDWILRDPEVDKALHEPTASETESAGSDTMLLGNVTYTMFENSWPQIAKDPHAPAELHKLADEVIGMTKLVFSRTRQEVPWENSKLFSGNLVEEVKKLKQGEGTSIIVFGSGTIVQQRTGARLIDEYYIAVTPVVLGKGKPLFGDVEKLNLQLVEARSFQSVNVLLRYEV